MQLLVCVALLLWDSLVNGLLTNLTELSDEKRLLRDVLNSYKLVGRLGRPVHNVSNSLEVTFAMGVITLDVEEKENTLTLSGWTRLAWKDEYLTWDPALYANISVIYLPTSAIWIPDIMLVNTARTERSEREVSVVVNHMGRVNWFPHRIFHSSCSIDVTNFPFDSQNCRLLFSSWTHQANELDLRMDPIISSGVDLSTFQSDFKESCKWSIVNVTSERVVDGPAALLFYFNLQRRLIFSSYILTLPAIFMSLLTLLVFWIPSDSADKSGIGMTIFGSLLLLLLILVEAAPPTAAAIPKLGIYYCFNIVIVMLSIFLSSLISHVSAEVKDYSQRKQVPRMLLKCTHCLARILCLPTPDFESDAKDCADATRRNSEDESEELTRFVSNVSKALLESNDVSNHRCKSAPPSDSLHRLVNSIQEYIDRRQEERNKAAISLRINRQWAYIGRVLDRVFLIIYLIVISLSVAFLFPRYQ